jgi:hypothetical protein
MLDVNARFTIPELPGLLIYPDDGQDAGFYAIRASPRVATDDDGVPQISLVLYGRKEGAALRIRGGLLALTTTLQLTADEENAVRRALPRLLAERASPRRGAGAPAPQLLSADWLDGEVDARLTQDLTLSAKPSLIGANQATFNKNLGATDAERLRKAWDGGLPDGWIRYRLQVRGARGHSTVEVREVTERQRGTASTSERASFAVKTSGAQSRPSSLTLEGPFGMSRGELAGRLTVANM